MVIDKSCTKYICTLCGSDYNNHNDAEDCYRNCHSQSCVADIDEINVERYQCEMCGKEYDSNIAAGKCEQKHTQKEDKWFILYDSNKKMQKLIEIGSHPMQKKIHSYIGDHI